MNYKNNALFLQMFINNLQYFFYKTCISFRLGGNFLINRYLLELGRSLEYLKDMVVNAAMSQALKYTVLSSVMAAVAWPAALLGASSVIDNPWFVIN